jgi:hypothetical protein
MAITENFELRAVSSIDSLEHEIINRSLYGKVFVCEGMAALATRLQIHSFFVVRSKVFPHHLLDLAKLIAFTPVIHKLPCIL